MNIQDNEININKYRKLVQTYINLHMYNAALFWADKVVAITNANPSDVYWLAQCMFLLKQYHRAAHLIKSHNLDKTYILCNNLAVRCLLEANELNDALNVLSTMDFEHLLEPSNAESNIGLFDDTPKHQVLSSVLFMKGKVLEAMDNRGLASECYRQALQRDVHCFEAFDALVQHHMLTASEEDELLNLLPISQQCNAEEAEVLMLLYKSKLKKYHAPSEIGTSLISNFKEERPVNYNIAITTIGISAPNSISTPNDESAYHITKKIESSGEEMHTEKQENIIISRLKNSLDLVVTQAEKHYYDCDYQQCTLLTERVLKQDPYHTSCLPIHISCQVELKQSNTLFTLGHNLVDLYPNLAISWFAVGCYYYVIGKRDAARRYLAKATSLDRLFGPAWLAYGHSFAVENEHDQAMAAYFKASQLMKGCHLPLLYIGLECGLTNNVRLAEKFFQQANKIAPEDPFVMHEMGVIAFQNINYFAARDYFTNALDIIKRNKKSVMPQRWAPLLNNLGHCFRKLKNYKEALKYHYQALVLCPQSSSTYSGIAYVYALMGNLEESVDWFHKALSLRRDDTFSSTMLNYVIEQLCEQQQTPYLGATEEIPNYEIPTHDIGIDIPSESTHETANSEMDISVET